MSKLRLGTLLLTAVALIAFLPSSAQAQDIEAGIDIWQTRGDGSTFAKFDTNPLPADFFCSGSAPFAGKIVFKGKPIATEPAGAFGNADTLLERLDHASFDENGVAVTRLQMRAMQFEGVELLTNECGSFKVELVLNGEQPITEMTIYQPKQPRGLAYRGTRAQPARFSTEIAVNTLIRFIPVDHRAPVLEVPQSAVFPPLPNAYWSERPGDRGLAFRSFVKVDTNSDGLPDTFVPGTSRNFAAGWVGQQTQVEYWQSELERVRAGQSSSLAQRIVQQEAAFCHTAECGQHCAGVVFDDPAAEQ